MISKHKNALGQNVYEFDEKDLREFLWKVAVKAHKAKFLLMITEPIGEDQRTSEEIFVDSALKELKLK